MSHEHSFIQAIIANVKDKDKVKAIEVEVGDLAGIEPGHLAGHLKEETGWDVSTSVRKSKVRCACGYDGEAKVRERLHDMVIFECPKCGEIPEVMEGKDIKITKIVLDNE
jgi:Zn finger protein HypA/HybF involved in hydrogenase expression